MLKMQKEGKAGVLYCWKCKHKVRLGVYSIENDKLRYGLGFILLKMIKQGTAGVWFC